MPIVSFSISETLRRFIKKLVYGGQYKNSSTILREALTLMMNSYSTTTQDIYLNTVEENNFGIINKTLGNVIIVLEKGNSVIDKKLAKIEEKYITSIKGKTCTYYRNYKTIIYIIEEYIQKFQLFVAELNEIEELKNIRYIII